MKLVENCIDTVVCTIECDKPDALKIITGDINNCQFRKCILHHNKKFITFPTRHDKMSD